MLTPTEFLQQPPRFQAAELIVGKQGSKGAQLTTGDGGVCTLKFGTATAPCQAPFGLSSWQGEQTDRVSLDLRVSPEGEQCIKSIDEAISLYGEIVALPLLERLLESLLESLLELVLELLLESLLAM